MGNLMITGDNNRLRAAPAHLRALLNETHWRPCNLDSTLNTAKHRSSSFYLTMQYLSREFYAIRAGRTKMDALLAYFGNAPATFAFTETLFCRSSMSAHANITPNNSRKSMFSTILKCVDEEWVTRQLREGKTIGRIQVAGVLGWDVIVCVPENLSLWVVQCINHRDSQSKASN